MLCVCTYNNYRFSILKSKPLRCTGFVTGMGRKVIHSMGEENSYWRLVKDEGGWLCLRDVGCRLCDFE